LNREKNKRPIVKRRKMVQNLKKLLRKLLMKIKSIIMKGRSNANTVMRKRK
jgi:hypothetical protein